MSKFIESKPGKGDGMTNEKAKCPNCGHEFDAINNSEVDCPVCDMSFVFCDDEPSIWD